MTSSDEVHNTRCGRLGRSGPIDQVVKTKDCSTKTSESFAKIVLHFKTIT